MSNVAQQRRNGRITRHRRVRKKIHGTAARPRLAVHRTNKHLSVQVIDDDAGRTLAAASTTEASLRGDGNGKVVFDRGGYLYHGRIAAVAAAAREAGLEF